MTKDMTTFQLLVDGSESSEAAANYAIKLASVYDAEIIPTNVIDTRRFRTPSSVETMKKVTEKFTENLHTSAINHHVEISPGKTITANPINDILAETKAIGADLIVTGAAGYTRERINNIASEILKRARCNVILARDSLKSENVCNRVCNRMLVPIRENEHTAEYAASLAKQFGSDLVACNTIGNKDLPPERLVYMSEAASQTDRVLGERVKRTATMEARMKQAYIRRAQKETEAFVGIAKKKGVHTESVVLEGDAVNVIPKYTESEHFGMMVLEYHNKGRFSRILSSNIAEKLAQSVSCSVFVVKNR